jgi:hypothetical protein
MALALLAADQLTFSQFAAPQARLKTPPIDLDQPAMPYSYPTPHKCGDPALALLDTHETKALIHDYGFGSDSLWAFCSQVDLPWLPTARVLRITALVPDHTDDNRELTLVQASPESRLWVVPIINGMVGYARTEENIHNFAAFNDLLHMGKHKVTDENVEELSDLYQWIVGMTVIVKPPVVPMTLRETLSADHDFEGSISHDRDGTDYTHFERNGDSWSSSSFVWEFWYSTEGDSSRLAGVTRKTLMQYKKDH